MFDYDENAKKAAQVLDQYNFTSMLKDCYGVSIYEIIDQLTQYNENVADALNDLSSDEVADYLYQRYGMYVQEVTELYVSWNDWYKPSKTNQKNTKNP